MGAAPIRAVLPATYEKWRYAADKGVRHFEARGIDVIRAKIDPDEFTRWCGIRGLKLDAKARTAFANEIAGKIAKQTH